MRGHPYLLLTYAGAAWGFGFPLAKLALREVDVGHMVMLRMAVAGLVALPFALRTRAARAMWRSPQALIAGAVYGPPFVMQFEGLARMTVSLAGLLVGLVPVLATGASVLWGERPTRGAWAGVAAATLGGALIAGTAGSAGGTPFGVVLMLASLALFVAYLGFARRIPCEADAAGGAAVVMVMAAISTGAIVLARNGPVMPPLSPTGWTAIAAQGVFCTALATLAWQVAAPRVPTSSAGVFINLEPLVASALGVTLFGDPLTGWLLAGGALIVAGSLCAVLSGSPDSATTRHEIAS